MRVCLSQPREKHFSVGTVRALALGALGALGLLAVATFCDLFEPSAGDPPAAAERHGDMNLRGLISEAEPQRQGRRLPDDHSDKNIDE